MKRLVYSEAPETTLESTTYANIFLNWNLAVLVVHESEKKSVSICDSSIDFAALTIKPCFFSVV